MQTFLINSVCFACFDADFFPSRLWKQQKMETEALTLNEQKGASPRKTSDAQDKSTVHFLSVSNSSIVQSKSSITDTAPESDSTSRQVAPSTRKPQNYMILSLVTLFFNCPFGCAAVVFSLLSSKSYFEGRRKEAAQRGGIAKWVSIVGLAVSVVVVLFVIVYAVVIVPNVIDNAQDLMNN